MTGDHIEPRASGQEAPGTVRLPAWKALVFSCIPLAALLAAGELGVRAARGQLLDLSNVRAAHIRLMQRSFPWRHDPDLGYVPAPTATGTESPWGVPLTVRADGLRSNGKPAAPPGRTILAVGDSMTFGDGVGDGDTWPAQLEERVNLPVLNAGVFGYGVDQMTLLAERLVPRFRPALLIADVNPAAVYRCELSCGAAPKPYFTIASGRLVAAGLPVPEPAFSGARGWKRALGYSHLADAVLTRIARQWWLVDVVTTRAHDRSAEVAALLVDRLIGLCEREGCDLLLVVHPTRMDPALTGPLVARARGRGVPVLELDRLARLRMSTDPGLARTWFLPDGHTSPAGNRWVAERIASALAPRLPPTSSVASHPAPPPQGGSG